MLPYEVKPVGGTKDINRSKTDSHNSCRISTKDSNILDQHRVSVSGDICVVSKMAKFSDAELVITA